VVCYRITVTVADPIAIRHVEGIRESMSSDVSSEMPSWSQIRIAESILSGIESV
jgi:hypothetical protein